MIDWNEFALIRAALGRPLLRFGELQRVVQNPRTLSSKLKKLEGDGLLVKENGLYRLTQTGEEAARILESYQELVGGGLHFSNLERVPHASYQPLLRDYCEILWRSYRPRLEGIVLFGSVARGDWRKESDIDLLTVVEGWSRLREWERADELSSLKGKLARLDSHARAIKAGFYPAIHALPLDPAELKNFQPLFLDISADGIILFDRKGVISNFIASVRDWAKGAGTMRIVRPDGSSYWVLKKIELGEVVELGH